MGVNLVRRFTDPAARQTIVNWAEVAWAGLTRLRHQLNRTPFDDQLAELVAVAEQAVTAIPRPGFPPTDLVVCPWIRAGGQVVKTIGIAARFDATAEVTLDELRIELAYPLDQPSDRFFRQRVT